MLPIVFAVVSAAIIGQDKFQVFTNCIQGQLLPEQIFTSSSGGKYEDLKTGYKAIKDRNPAGIFLAKSEAQVVKALECANLANIQPVPRSGGHSYESFSSQDDALVIDLSDMADVRIIEKQGNEGIATVQGGARLGNVYLALAKDDFNFNAGTCPSVGIGGHLSGGGFGMLGRLRGLAADQVIKMRVVLANATVVTASATENADLFWALRGGNSGSFGIITEFTIRVVKTPEVTMFRYQFDLSKAPELIEKYMNGFMGKVEPRITTQLDLFKSGSRLHGQFTGPKADLLQFLDSTGITSIQDAQKIEIRDDCTLAGIKAFLWGPNQSCDDPGVIETPHQLPSGFKDYGKNKADYADKLLNEEGINTVYEFLQNSPDGAWLQFEALGGALAEHSVSETPYYNRKALFSMQYQVPLQKGESRDSDNWKWIKDLEAALKPHTNGHHYQNYPDLDIGPDYGQAYFGADNFDRLKKIKAIYDPTNIFRNEQSIPLP